MATGNVNLTSTESNITVTSTPSNIIVTDIETGDQITVTTSNTNVSVTSDTTNVTVSDFAVVANSTIRSALSNVSPILYDSGTGVFSFDSDASFAGKTTDDLAEGNTNLYLNGAGTTDDLAEGTANLWYTNARVLAYIQDNGLDFNAEKVDDRVANLLQTTGNLTFTYDDGANTLTLSQSLTTDDISEGTNLYYSNTRVNTYIGSTGLTIGGDSVVQGNLNVQGNIDYTHVNDLYVANNEIIMNANAATDSDVMITVNRPVSGANTQLKWNESTNIWEFTNDGSTYYPIPTSTTDLAEGTNLYYTDARIEGYTGNITQLNEANISRLYVGQDNLGLDSGLGTFFDFQMVKQNDQYFTTKQLSRNTSLGITEAIIKSRGTASVPTIISGNDRIHEVDYYGHDGTNFVQTFGEHIYQDAFTGGISTGTIPLAMEIYTKQNGVSSTFDQSLVKFRADRTIAFNDTGTRGFGSGQGNANIQMDGTINTVSNVNATGTIYAGSMTPDDITLKSFQETVTNLGNINGDLSSTIDGNTGSIFTLTANGGITINTIANASTGSSYTIKITQDGTGNRLLTSSMKFVGGDKTLSTGSGNIDVISVVYDGTDYLASLTKDYK
jgi:hypothetical protein